MTISKDGTKVRLAGDCRVEEAEALVALLQAGGIQSADLSECRCLHAAVAQALIAFGVRIESGAGEPFLRDVVIPALQAAVARRGQDGRLKTAAGGPTEMRS